MPSFLAHMMVLIDAANKLQGPDELAARDFLFPDPSDHPVVTELDIGKAISQMALLGANGPDIPGYRSFDVDVDAFVLAILGGGSMAFAAIYATMMIGGERDQDSTALKASVVAGGFGLGALLLFLPLPLQKDDPPKRWWNLLGSMAGLPLLASGASLIFLYSKEDTKPAKHRQSLWGIAILAAGAGLLALGAGLSLSDVQPYDYNMVISYLVGMVIGLIFAFGIALLLLYKGADRLTSIFKAISMLVCGVFLTILFPVLFSKVPNFAKDKKNQPLKEHWFDMLHKHRSGDFAIALINQAKEAKTWLRDAESKRLMAFALGYVSHLAADTVVHPYVNMFGDSEDTETWYGDFHRAVEVTQDSWLAKDFFQRDDVFTGGSWTEYINGTMSYADQLDEYYRNAYRVVYGDMPPIGFVSDSHGVLVDLVADSAFDNEVYSARMPLMWLGGLFPFLFGGFLPSVLWSFPWSPYMRLVRAVDLDEATVREAISKSVIPTQLGDRIGMVPGETRDAIWTRLGQAADEIRAEHVETVDRAMALIEGLLPEQRKAILDALDIDKIRTGASLSIALSGAASLWDWFSELGWPDHWAPHHIGFEIGTWLDMAVSFGLLWCNSPTVVKVAAPFYYLGSALQGAFSLDKMLYSKLTSKSVIPPQDPADSRVHHTGLPNATRYAFYRGTLLDKAVEQTQKLWIAAVQFYNDTIDERAFADVLRNWNIDTGYRIEAKMEKGATPADDKVTVTFIHSWREFGIG
jgi:hypothetical protein